ncbi:MAG TPA: hypothetical protein VMG35_26635 [Bryobacteraceae bacterium]|nr:hypothetical protein [Bryobacteraceae bacterium]
MPTRSDKDVRRLDVAMDDSGRVRLQCVGGLNGEPEEVVQRQGRARNEMFQRRAFQALHHQKWAALVLANVVKRTDVGMV